jgi:hypothetical protein
MLAEQDNMGELFPQRCAQLLGHIFAEVVWVAGWVDAVVGGRHREHATRRKDAGELGDDLVLACNVLDDLKAHHQIESTVVEWQGVDVASHELKRGCETLAAVTASWAMSVPIASAAPAAASMAVP